jgi:hypothetical protein
MSPIYIKTSDTKNIFRTDISLHQNLHRVGMSSQNG